MYSEPETQKRILIARTIADLVEPHVRCVVVGGSVGYGANFSVTGDSDIDMVVVCPIPETRRLTKLPFFRNRTPENITQMFEQKAIDMFWVSREINSVEVNIFLYEPCAYERFCTTQGCITAYKPTKPAPVQDSYLFDGSCVTFDRSVRAFDEGYLYERPPLADGRFYGGMPRNDFLIRSLLLYQQGSYFHNLREKVWHTAIAQLIKEHGPHPDIEQHNILNTLYAYSHTPEKVPPVVQQEIHQETELRLKAKLG